MSEGRTRSLLENPHSRFSSAALGFPINSLLRSVAVVVDLTE